MGTWPFAQELHVGLPMRTLHDKECLPDQGPQAAWREVKQFIKPCDMPPAGVVIRRGGLLLGWTDHVVCPGVLPACLEAAEGLPIVRHWVGASCLACIARKAPQLAILRL